MYLFALVSTGCGNYQKAFPREIAVDSSGRVVVMGYAIGGNRPLISSGGSPYSGSSTSQYVLMSEDGGSSWITALYLNCEAGLLFYAPSLGRSIFGGQT